jgi:glycosyltransferase involved in cell wall biosynthesis
MGLGRLLFPFVKPGRPFFSSSLFCAEYFREVARDLKREGFDVVHILNFSQMVPRVRKCSPDSRIVLHMQCEWLTQLDRRIIERRLRETDLVLGCSKFITHSIQGRFPGLASRCRTLYNGVNAERLGGPETPRRKEDGVKRVLYVGRVSPEKGIHILFQAFERLALTCPDAVLDIVGWEKPAAREFITPGKAGGRMAELAKQFAGGYRRRLETGIDPVIRQRIRFVGHIPNEDLDRYYRAADVVVFPSVWDEPFGIPPVEAMAAGVPVVCSDTGGIRETVLDGKTGFLVPPGEPEALSDALARVLLDPALQHEMGRAARERAGMFAWPRIAEELMSCYRQAGGGSGRGRTE